MDEFENTKDRGKIFLTVLYVSCRCILLTVFVYFTIQKARFIIDFDAPKELREMTSVAIAHQFAFGKNPYAYTVLESEIPSVTSIYGLLVPLLMSPFIRLFSAASLSTLQICQLITLFVEIMGSVFFYCTLLRKTEHSLLALCGAFLFHTCYWRYTAFGGAFPDQWGLTLSVILMGVITVDEQRGHYRPLLYAVLIIGLFYCKQYFVLILIGLCVYLFLYSKKDLIRLLFYGGLIGTLTVIGTYLFFPLYFAEVFPIAHGQTITGDSAYSFVQIKKLSIYYGPVVLFAMIGFLIKLYHMIRARKLRGMVTYELCQIIFIFPPLLRIAENQGTNYTYYLQLWYPYIIFYGIVSVSALLKYNCSELTVFLHTRCAKTIAPIIYYIAICLLCILSIIRVLPSYDCPVLSSGQKQSWYRAYDILDRYSAEGEILVSMVLSNYCLEHDIATSNFGQAEFNNLKNLENYRSSRLWRNIFLFDDTEALLQKNISYNQTIREKIYSQSYSCIALVYAGEYHLTEDDLIIAGYQISEAEELATGTQNWYTVFYTLAD